VQLGGVLGCLELVHAPASLAADDPLLGCPVEYISLKGTSYDKPAVCKYTGNKVGPGVWAVETGAWPA
jgi:hypothetical protein